MEKIITKDHSVTFHNDDYDETYHSTSGAKEEAIKKFAEPCNIQSFKKVAILDICFGIGYNSAAALDLFKGTKIEILAIENDQNIIDTIQSVDAPFQSYPIIKTLAQNKTFIDDNHDLTLNIADARDILPTFSDNHFDVIFLDPFSPKKCPELWTEEFFKEIYRVSKQGARLATYSCARIVRDNLKAAGFKVKDGPVVGRRAPSTLADKP